MSDDIQIVLVGRTPEIQKMVEDCAAGKLGFTELCEKVRAMGYNTNSLYEMVMSQKGWTK